MSILHRFRKDKPPSSEPAPQHEVEPAPAPTPNVPSAAMLKSDLEWELKKANAAGYQEATDYFLSMMKEINRQHKDTTDFYHDLICMQHRMTPAQIAAELAKFIPKSDPIVTPMHVDRVDRGFGNRPMLPAPRSARLRARFRESIRPSLRFTIFRRDNYRCQLCGAHASDTVRLEVDHKIPVAKGGTNDEANLWLLCWECNSGKSDRDL